MPAEAITPAKQEKLLRLAEHYLGEHPPSSDCSIRFDVICISGSRLEHIENAFDQSMS